jgi:hypothetical protein
MNLNIYYILAGGFGLSIVVMEEDTFEKLEKALVNAVELSTLKTSKKNHIFVCWIFCVVVLEEEKS